MAEWFKATDCKSAKFSYRRFESCFLHLIKLSKYNVVVACLLWEQKVMCSNHIISIFYIRWVKKNCLTISLLFKIRKINKKIMKHVTV